MQVLWLRFLTEIGENTVEAPQELLSDPIVSKALKTIKESAFTPAQLYSYEKFWDIISVEKTLYYGAIRKGMAEGKAQGKAQGIAQGIAQGMEKGLKEGMKEGMKEGIKEGIAKGIAKGKAEEQRLIATQFKKNGITPEIIAQCTGLSVEEIDLL